MSPRFFLFSLFSLLVLLSLVACRPPADPPGEVGEIARYLYSYFDTRRQDEVVAGIQALEPMLAARDLESEDEDDRVWPVPTLTNEYLGAIEPTPGAVAEEQVAAALGGMYQHEWADMLELLLDPNQVCIASGSYLYYQRSFEGDTACFEDESCEWIEATNVSYSATLGLEMWLRFPMEARRVRLDDGRPALIWRGWLEETSDAVTDWAEVEQRYTLDLAFPTGDEGMVRFIANWYSFGDGTLGDDAVYQMMIGGMSSAIVTENAFTAGEVCERDRDAQYEPPF
jgi:hypothetical protein